MSNLSSILWLIPALPLAASIVTAFLGPRLLRQHSHWPCILAAVASCILSFLVLVSVQHGGEDIVSYYTWFHAGNVDVGFTLRADALTAFMLVTVTFISSLIAIYSVGYMHGDEGYARFFAEVALFIFSMTGLVLADNFLLLYAFWEGVGVCSYLLIGFWFTKPSAAAAAMKAFLVTRLGDLGFLLGIILLWFTFGYSLDYQTVFAQAHRVAADNPAIMTTICLLLFCGAVGKSAQFPLYVWLPDAMEGPTPVSALIHAATMVTAGVYMVGRCTVLYAHAPAAQAVVAAIGGFTALLAALIALTQNDLKRVLAYSTISQLGYMFMGVGSGATTAGIFHLYTHAFFKALLFLAAGSVMHAMGNVIDMRRIGGLRFRMPVTHATFLCGALALAGVPFVASGFWSKDDIFAGLLGAYQEHPFTEVFLLVFLSSLLTAALTSFYTFRAYFLTFWGPERIPHEAGEHAHESPRVMTVPLIILAVGAIAAGFVNAEPFTDWVSHFLQTTPYLRGATGPHLHVGARIELWVGSLLLAGSGIGLAWWIYVRQPGLAARLALKVQSLYQLSLNKFHVDELYDALIIKSLDGFAEFCRIFDLYVIDGLVDLFGQVPRLVGNLFRPVQNGLVQFYALAMVLGLVVFLIALVTRS